MSWDVILQKFPEGASRPEQVPEDYLPAAIGSRADVASAVRKLFRNVEGDSDLFLTIFRSAFAIEISLGDKEPCSQLFLHVHDDHAAATKAILRIAEHFGMRAVDCSTGEFLVAARGRRRHEASEQERADAERYRWRVEEALKNPVPRPEWPLSGLEEHPNPCRRYIYMSFLPGESPTQLQKAVFRAFPGVYRPATTGGPHFVLTLPDGEPFGDIEVTRLPVLVTETEAEMIPWVQEMVALMHSFAASTGRRTGEIEERSVFVCDDGQRIPITQCVYRELRTEADWKAKPKKKKG
jgi:hypothetical protein